MLQITVPETETWNSETDEFGTEKAVTLTLEHSLVSLSKWESKWHKPFLSNIAKTNAEVLDYIKCMTLTQNVKDSVYDRLSKDNIKAIRDYIDDPMTASSVTEHESNRRKSETITSELIYYWMIQLNIPFKCEKWHLNRLLMLIKICNAKNNPKKMTTNQILKSNAALNAARRKSLHSRG